MKSILLKSLIGFIALLNINSATAQNVVVKQNPYAVDLGTDLRICIDFAGLGNISQIGIQVNYTAQVTSLCYNKGKDSGPVPGLTKTSSGSTQVTFDVHNGRAQGCKSLGLSFTAGDCPSANMRGEVSDVSFSNVTLTVRGQTFNVPVQ